VSIPTASLGEVADFINGAAFKPEDWGDEGLPIIRIQNLTDHSKALNRTLRKVDDRYHVRNGELLVSWSASLGVFEWQRGDALLNQHIFRVIPNAEVIDKKYLFYALTGALQDMERHLHGATMRHVNREEFLGTKICLPLLGEQRRIVTILDRADALRRKQTNSIHKFTYLENAFYLEMFGDPKFNPKKLRKAPLSELIQVSSGDGLTKEQQLDGPYPVYGGNGIAGYHKEFNVPRNTITIGRVGVYCGAVHVTEDNAWVTDNALIVRIKSSELTTGYLATSLRLANFNQYAGRSAQPLVSGSRIYPVEILMPLLADQKKFDVVLSKLARLGSGYNSAKKRIDDLFDVLQRKLFANGAA